MYVQASKSVSKRENIGKGTKYLDKKCLTNKNVTNVTQEFLQKYHSLMALQWENGTQGFVFCTLDS